ncbi:MAG: hypothetical protein J6U54_23595 [Clostridiales bacterium]|nr:hypothetical protein [Clostridiales bacterium]
MKITITLGQVNASVPVLSELGGQKLPFNIGFKLFTISEKLEKVLSYMRERSYKELAGLEEKEATDKVNEILSTKIEIDLDLIDREELKAGLGDGSIKISPAGISAISFLFTEDTSVEEPFKVL